MDNFNPSQSDDSEVRSLNLPPHSIEAEQSLLGGLMLENAAWDKVADLVVETDFYRHEHRLVFRAISNLINESRPADVITVQDELKLHEQLEQAGGFDYLVTLAQTT